MQEIYHYTPELFELLVEAIPRMFRSKRSVLVFFRGAGVDLSLLADLKRKVAEDRSGISKFEIVRTVLTRLNENGDKYLRERREVLKRVIEFEDFSTCWPEDELKAKGLVAEIQRVVNVKDSFTRMRQERYAEVKKARDAQRTQESTIRHRREIMEGIKRDFYSLFAMDDNPQRRGRLLEEVLNRLFKVVGIHVQDDFRRVSETGQGVVEQIDGIIELRGKLYLVEMKWLNKPVDVGDVSHHLVRVFGRSSTGGIFISYSGYTKPAIDLCRESLNKADIVLCTLEEFVLMLESETSLEEFLQAKIQGRFFTNSRFLVSSDQDSQCVEESISGQGRRGIRYLARFIPTILQPIVASFLDFSTPIWVRHARLSQILSSH